MAQLTQQQIDNLIKRGVSKEQINRFSQTGAVSPKKTATFEAVPGQTIREPLRLVGNIPRSAFEFGKGFVTGTAKIPGTILKQIPEQFGELKEEVGGVGEALKATGREIPGQLLKIIPESARALATGDTEKAEMLLVEDPVGQILPWLIAGRAAAASKGKTVQFDTAVSNIAKPVTTPIKAGIQATTGAVGKVTTAGLGVLTGTGRLPLQEAFKSGRTRGLGILEETPFSKALRGKTEPTAIVEEASNAVNIIKEVRATKYLEQFRKVTKNKQSLDISPINKVFQEQLKKYNIKIDKNGNVDFSRSTIGKAEAIADVKGVVELMRTWGARKGDRSAIGLDILKRKLGDFYSQSGQARSFVQNIKSGTTNVLNKNVKGYKEMTKDYTEISRLLDDMKQGLSLGGKSGIDTILRKLTSAMRKDNEFRTQLLEQLEQVSGVELTEGIAGASLAGLPAKGLVGRGIQAGAGFSVLAGILSPQVLTSLLFTSPRVVGEFLQALGTTTTQTQSLLRVLNELRPLFPVKK